MRNMTVMDYVIKATAKQLGIEEENVTLDTVIPNIQHMMQFACVHLRKVIMVNDLSAEFTVEKAIEEFER